MDYVAKTLCDWSKKDIEKHFDALCEITNAPRFTCRKCARSAHDSKHLCKPRKRIDTGSSARNGNDGK